MLKYLNKCAMSAIFFTGIAAADSSGIVITPPGSSPSVAGLPENFTGPVIVDYLNPQSVKAPAATGLVTFPPGSRTAWHTHPSGQLLIVTAGKGWIEKEGEPRSEIKTGDTVWIPAGVKHWHGATDTTGMSHISVTFIKDGKNADWFGPVTDKQYKQE